MLLDKRSDMVDNKDRLADLLAGAVTVFDISGTFFLRPKEPRVGYTAVSPLPSDALFDDLEQDIKALALDFEMALARAQSE